MIPHLLQALPQSAVREKIDLLLREIERGLHIHAQINQRFGDALHHDGELALQRAHGSARRDARAGVDEICYGLGLRQIELVVQERALRELAGQSAPRAELHGARDERLLHDGAAVPLQFEHVLAGIRVRRRKKEGKSRINRFLPGIEKTAEGRHARGRQSA